MPLANHSEQSSGIRDQARTLVARTGEHEQHLSALVAAAETDVRNAEAALLRSLEVAHLALDRLRHELCTQLQRSEERAESVRKLRESSREQHLAASRLLTQIDLDADGGEPHASGDAILVVDDYRNVRDVVAEVLENAGFTVRTAGNGLEALLAAYEMRPGIIIMDVSMPVLDGIEATRLIKATDATRHARVIAHTGGAVLSGLVPRLFDAVLQKPSTPAAVLAAVREVASL